LAGTLIRSFESLLLACCCYYTDQ